MTKRGKIILGGVIGLCVIAGIAGASNPSTTQLNSRNSADKTNSSQQQATPAASTQDSAAPTSDSSSDTGTSGSDKSANVSSDSSSSSEDAAAPSATTSPSTCYPLSDEGGCYEPGEYCRDSDHGANGLAGDGKQITCEDNDGWRWEPV